MSYKQTCAKYWTNSPMCLETFLPLTHCIFFGLQNHCSDCSHEIKTLAPWKESYNKPRQHIKKQRYNFADKGPYSQSYGVSSSHVWMGEMDHKEGWMPKNWCFWIVMLKKTLESPMDSKEIKPVNPKGNQPRIFTGRTDAEVEAPILWPSDVESLLIGKYSDARKDQGLEEKGMTENKMVGWHHSTMTQWTWVWAGSGRWCRTEKPSQSMGLQRIRHHWETEQQQHLIKQNGISTSTGWPQVAFTDTWVGQDWKN